MFMVYTKAKNLAKWFWLFKNNENPDCKSAIFNFFFYLKCVWPYRLLADQWLKQTKIITGLMGFITV